MCNETGLEGSAHAKKRELRGRREGEGVDFGGLRGKNALFGIKCGNMGKACNFCVRSGDAAGPGAEGNRVEVCGNGSAAVFV